jgi:hypothetical protein
MSSAHGSDEKDTHTESDDDNPLRVAVSPRRVYIATQERRRNRTSILDPYTALIGPGYCETRESMVSSVTPRQSPVPLRFCRKDPYESAAGCRLQPRDH